MRNRKKQENLFRDPLLSNPKYSHWVQVHTKQDSSLLNHPGEVTFHIESDVSVIENIFLQSIQNQNSIMLSFDNKAKRKVEIKWSLFSVRHGFSDNYFLVTFVSTLSRMFPEVDNVKNLALGKDRIR